MNRLMTAYVDGMAAKESDELLERAVRSRRSSRKFIYEHVWNPGDVVMWDNRCALHARTTSSPAERRLMRRVTILGEKPV